MPSIRIFPNEKCWNFMTYQAPYQVPIELTLWLLTSRRGRCCDLSAGCRSANGGARSRAGPWLPFSGTRRVQSSCKRVKSSCGSVPAQLIHVVNERNVGAERGQCPKKQCTVPFAAKRTCKGARVGGVHAPLAAVARDGFEMKELGKHSC